MSSLADLAAAEVLRHFYSREDAIKVIGDHLPLQVTELVKNLPLESNYNREFEALVVSRARALAGAAHQAVAWQEFDVRVAGRIREYDFRVGRGHVHGYFIERPYVVFAVYEFLYFL
jgi:hypothetical protein